MKDKGYQTPPRAPTLEEVIKILNIAKNFEFSYDFESDRIRCTFFVNKKDCEAEDLHVSMFASVFLSEMREHLARLAYFEDLVKKYSNPDTMGSTAADCINFLRNEIKNLYGGTLESKMKQSFFKTIIEKLTELGAWRTFVDAERFEKQRQQEEAIRRQQEAAEKARKRWEWERSQEEKVWGNPFEQERNHFEEIFRRAQEEMFRKGYSNFRFNEGFDTYSNQQQENRHGRNRSDKVRSSGKWWEVLGVKQNATKATIKSAWRRLAKQHHPDRKGGDPAKMAEINAAKDEGLSGASS